MLRILNTIKRCYGVIRLLKTPLLRALNVIKPQYYILSLFIASFYIFAHVTFNSLTLLDYLHVCTKKIILEHKTQLLEDNLFELKKEIAILYGNTLHSDSYLESFARNNKVLIKDNETLIILN